MDRSDRRSKKRRLDKFERLYEEENSMKGIKIENIKEKIIDMNTQQRNTHEFDDDKDKIDDDIENSNLENIDSLFQSKEILLRRIKFVKPFFFQI